MKILIAEDEYVSQQLINSILSEYGNCVVVSDGNQAMLAFQNALNNGEPFDFICLDIRMPEMDGLEVLKEIRKIERDKGINKQSMVKIIMITAMEDHGNLTKALVQECQAYYIKPIERKRLVEMMQQCGVI